MTSLPNRKALILLYFQATESIYNKIAQNVYKPGEQIPTKTQFQDEYDVSIGAVRQLLT
jgi:DNA-binding GntR family transcriptional regulator